MNKIVFGFGLTALIFGVCLMIYAAYPLYEANYSVHYSSTAEWCNATDPYLHPKLGEASWLLLFSSFPFVLGIAATGMGLIMGKEKLVF